MRAPCWTGRHGLLRSRPYQREKFANGFLAGAFGLRAGLTTLSFLALAAATIAYLSRDAGGP